MRARAAEFAREWSDAHYEKGETQSFYNDFFGIFGIKRRSVAVYEKRVERLDNSTGFIDLFMPKVLLVEQKSAGRDLARAHIQAQDYFLAIPEVERPRYILACDFQTFDLKDLDAGDTLSFPLRELPEHVGKFGFLLGAKRHEFRDQDPVNIAAAELVGALHDALEASGFVGHDLERFLVRIVFCLFADDTGVFEPRNLFLDFIEQRTGEDGADLGGKLSELFQTLNTPEDTRYTNLDEDLTAFPYVNGELFAGVTRIPHFNKEMRDALLTAAKFDWSPISPAIFGSLFQSVMEPQERRVQGAHYTTEKNILKVIGPLFMDELWAEFQSIQRRRANKIGFLRTFHTKLGELRFFDPACGCGNFLIIAYRELRRLEIEVLKDLLAGREEALGEAGVGSLSRINVDQFYGIEISEFPAEIARAALWMMDHIMNNELSLAFGQNYARIPLRAAPHIVQGDALELDWGDVIAPERCNYILGNPPFGGFVMRDEQRQRQIEALAHLGAGGSRLDYVAYWFLKAGEFVNRADLPTRIGFVATNSISQGEQVAQLWPALFDRFKLEIAFAHQTFAWGSDARGRAHVHVIIIGLVRSDSEVSEKPLFVYRDINGEPEAITYRALTPYLFGASQLANRHLVVDRASQPKRGYPVMRVGTKPVDGGHLILDRAQHDELLALEPRAAGYIRPFIGGYEHLNGVERWIVHAQAIPPEEIRSMPAVMRRVNAVRESRTQSTGSLARSLAETPMAYHVTVVPTGAFIGLAEVSSVRREYIAAGLYDVPTIPSNQLLVIEHAEKWLFALLSSAAHAVWLKNIGGRLKSDYRYSPGLVYNTFPWPELDADSKHRLSESAETIVAARSNHAGASLADLYDPDSMPADVRAAHRANDRLVDRLYRAKAFDNERERIEFLFKLYESTRLV